LQERKPRNWIQIVNLLRSNKIGMRMKFKDYGRNHKKRKE